MTDTSFRECLDQIAELKARINEMTAKLAQMHEAIALISGRPYIPDDPRVHWGTKR